MIKEKLQKRRKKLMISFSLKVANTTSNESGIQVSSSQTTNNQDPLTMM